MTTILEEFKRDWVKGKMFVTFTYDYLRDNIPTNTIEFQIVNVDGENMNRVFRTVGSATGAEATAFRSAMKREMDNQAIDIANGYIPYPEVAPIVPVQDQALSGIVAVQIQALSKTPGEMTVEYRIDGGAWQSTVYDSDSEYYEDSVDTTPVSDGLHQFEIRVTHASGVVLTVGPFTIDIDNIVVP